MPFARRVFRHWRWWMAVLAALSFYLLYERRPGGPFDLPRLIRSVERAEALVERDPLLAESLAAAAMPSAPADLRRRLLAVRARAGLRLMALGRRGFSPAAQREIATDIDRASPPDAGGLRRTLDEMALDASNPEELLRRETALAAGTLAVLDSLPVPPHPLLRARALFLLGRFPEAAAAARRAGEAGLYLEAESLRRLDRAGAEEPAVVLLRGPSPLAPLGHLVIGRLLLRRGDAAGWLHLAQAIPLLRSGWSISQAALDVRELYAELQRAAIEESDPDRLRGALAVFELWHAALPSDEAALSRAADLAVRRAQALAKADRDAESRTVRRSAVALYRKLASLHPVDSPAHVHALRRSAEELMAAGDFAEAADVFHDLPGKDSVFHEGVCLGRAGLVKTALERLNAYIDSVPREDALVPSAILERARLLASAGDPAALRELERFSPASGLSVSPEAREWREALLLKARLHLRRDEKREAREELREFVYRYGPAASGAPRSEVAFARAQLAVLEMGEGRLDEALGLLRQAREDLLGGAGFSEAETVEMAGVIMGDAYLGLNRPLEAHLSYDQAFQKLQDEKRREPLWLIVALAGRARASLRLGRGDEAERDYRRARELYETNRDRAGVQAFSAIEELRLELQTAKETKG